MTISSPNAEYFPVPIDAIQSEGLGFDLYLIYEGCQAVLYRKSGASYSMCDCDELREKGITHFYVRNVEHQQFQRAVCEQACDAFEDASVVREKRTRMVRDSCGKMIENFMTSQRVDGISETLGMMAGKFGEWCNNDKSEFSYLLDMSEHDFYTTTHMVNVGVGCTLLGAELLGNDHEMVQVLSLGGLIHDVGKCGVPTDVLNKEGKLSDDEWGMIRKHPELGASILRGQEGISPELVDMTLNHHERLDGKGYPNGIRADEISFHARVCSVVDVYDALSSARPYRGPIAPRAVLDMMREDVGKAFDAKVFGAWERVVERMIEEDPARAASGTEKPGMKLEAMIPSPIAQSRPENGFMTIRRGDGSGTSAEVVQTTLGEIILSGDVRLDCCEKVELHPEDGAAITAKYLSKRLGSRGETQLVFKPLMENRSVA
ncbi:MAG: HD-GYP domain-containing protein [bacterium]|nr:HD-GYP domain-containing protein [bacterium]